MKIYLDLLFLLNWWIDFFLLMIVKLTLKRVTKIRRIFLGSLVGALSIIFLFFNLNYFWLFFLKFFLGLIMCLISFKYRNFSYTLNNLIYLLMSGVILGGIINLIKPYLESKKVLYFIMIIVITPIFLISFIKQNRTLKRKYSFYYQVQLRFKNLKSINLSAFLDTGNKLIDPITNKPIILVEKKCLKGVYKIRSPMFVPVITINKKSLVECFKPDYIIINNRKYYNYLIGACENNLFSDGINCLLNNKLVEDL